MRILFDNSIRSDAIRAHYGFTRQEKKFLGHKVSYIQPANRRRPPRMDWRQSEIEALPKIAHLIHKGHIQPFTTNELELERLQTQEFPPIQVDDIFSRIQFEHLNSPLDRSKWDLEPGEIFSKCNIIQFCENFFLSCTPQTIDHFIISMKSNQRYNLTKFEEQCLRKASVFQSICRGIHSKHYPDALHLWTAIENKMDAFITVDRKFQNVMKRQSLSCCCEILLPSELLRCFQ